jgi:hypothetical protein
MKYVLTLLVIGMFCANVNAQTSASKSKMKHEKMSHPMKDCVMMKDGKMMMMKDGKMMTMDKDMKMGNGMVCMKDGTCKMKNGKTMKMKEGETCDMHGKMGKMKM